MPNRIVAASLLALLALISGCRKVYTRTVAAHPALTLSAVAVYPFAFRWDEPAYRSFELSQRLIDVVLAAHADQLLVFGPSEFRVYRPRDDNAWAASNLLSLLPEHGLGPEQALILRPWAERRVHTSQKDLFDARGKNIGRQLVQRTTYVGHVELLHPTSQLVLVELQGEAEVDPLEESEGPEFDPIPKLTTLMEALTRAALEVVEEELVAPSPPRPLPFSFAFNPQEALRYTDGSGPPLEVTLSAMDPLEAELMRLNRVLFANPELEEREATTLLRRMGGIYVLASEEGAPVQKGDLITSLDGQPALPQQLHRARFGPPRSARVRRESGEFVDLPLP